MTSSKRTGLPVLPAAASPPAPPPSGARLTPFWSHGEFTKCSADSMKLQHPGFTDDRHGILSTSLAKMHWTVLYLLLVFSTKYRVFPKPHSVSINMRSKFKRLSALNLDWMSLCVWVGDCVKILQTRSASFSTQLPIYASVVDDSQHLEQTPVSAVACCRWVRPQLLAANCSLSTLQASEEVIWTMTIARKTQRQGGPSKIF